MFWHCFNSTDNDDRLVDKSVELISISDSQNPTTQELAKKHKSISPSFSKFAWNVLKDLSLHQVLQTSQTYIHSQLQSHGVLSVTSPKEKKEQSENEWQDLSMSSSWSLLSVPSSPLNETLLASNSNSQPNSLPNTFSSAVIGSSMTNSLLDEILDEYDKKWTQKNLNTTTDDGFNSFSREVMSQKMGIYSEKCDENQSKEVVLNTMTTDDGMRQLAFDCMRRVPEENKAEEGRDDEEKGKEEEGKSKDENEKYKKGSVEEENKDEKHKLANHYMLNKLNKDILEKDITPGFVSSMFGQ